MLRRRWLSDLAAVGCLIASALACGSAFAKSPNPVFRAIELQQELLQQRADKDEAVADEAKEDANRNVDAEKAEFDAAFWRARRGDSETYRAICEKPKDRDYADLCQQWRVAEAAIEQSYWAQPQFIASALTVLGLVVTIVVSIRATNAAIKAAEATQEAATAAIGSELPNFAIIAINVGNKSDPVSYVTLLNAGKGSAVITGECLCPAIVHELAPNPIYSVYIERRVDFAAPIEPGKTYKVEKGGFYAPGEWRSVLDGDSNLWIYGYVDYLDFLKTEHRVGFCAKCEPIPDRSRDVPPSNYRFVQAGPASYTYSRRKTQAPARESLRSRIIGRLKDRRAAIKRPHTDDDDGFED